MANKYSIELVELSEQPALIIKSTVAADELSEQLAQSFGRVAEFIEKAHGAPSGMPFMRYLEMTDSKFVIAAGMPLAEAIDGEGDVEAHMLPGGRALTTLYLGDYAGVGAAWDDVWERAESLGATERSGGWDVYINDPSEVAPKEVATRLYLPIGAAGGAACRRFLACALWRDVGRTISSGNRLAKGLLRFRRCAVSSLPGFDPGGTPGRLRTLANDAE